MEVFKAIVVVGVMALIGSAWAQAPRPTSPGLAANGVKPQVLVAKGPQALESAHVRTLEARVAMLERRVALLEELAPKKPRPKPRPRPIDGSSGGNGGGTSGGGTNGGGASGMATAVPECAEFLQRYDAMLGECAAQLGPALGSMRDAYNATVASYQTWAVPDDAAKQAAVTACLGNITWVTQSRISLGCFE